jgi:hypothetical protein
MQEGSIITCDAFGDTHIHFLSYAFFSAGLDLREAGHPHRGATRLPSMGPGAS